jgi:beta-hydroxylase
MAGAGYHRPDQLASPGRCRARRPALVATGETVEDGDDSGRWKRRVEAASVTLGEKGLHALERILRPASLVPTTPFLPTGCLPWVGDFEKNWAVIRAELDEVMRYRQVLPEFATISPDQGSISGPGEWRTFFFRAYGLRAEGNCGRCPATASLLDSVPGLLTAFFSILAPGGRLTPHRGPYQGVLRYHLGLIVPDPAEACGISVGGEVAHWREGASLLFDDSYEHHAWNDTDQPRVVLFADVVRPYRGPAARVNGAVLRAIAASPFVQEAKARHDEWESQLAGNGVAP